MKEIILTIPKEEWSEKDNSKTWLFSRLQKGEVPSSPKYIKKVYSRLMKIKKENKELQFDFVRIEAPKKINKDRGMYGYAHNFLSICAHVFGKSSNGIVPSEEEELRFIISFKGD